MSVRGYSDRQLLERVQLLGSFTHFPKGYWILGVRSDEDAFDKFDDKFYLFRGKKFIMVTSGTTNPGAKPMLNYKQFNRKGVAVLKANQWYINCWRSGLHRKRMPALKQVRPMAFFRDWNKDKRIDEMGTLEHSLIGCEFHTATYSKDMSFVRRLIGGWSAGCQVANNTKDYYKMLEHIGTAPISYCLIKEF